MPTLHVNGLVKGYGADTVFDGVSFRVTPRERLALVGRNGSGKTTLLRVLSGELEPDGGQVARPRAYRIALHDQRPPLAREITLGGYISEGLADLHAAEERLRGARTAHGRRRRIAETLRAYEAATVAHEAAGGYAWRSRLESILRGLGFDPVVADRPLSIVLRWRADARLAGAGTRGQPRSAAARRADQPPRPALARMARGRADLAGRLDRARVA